MIRIGVVGYGGRISRFTPGTLRQAVPDVRIVGVVDPDEEGVRSRLEECDRGDVVFYESLDQMVRNANLDGLIIGTRCNLHTPYAIEAFKYDVPLFLEKPISTSMEQALALEAAWENSRGPTVVSFPLRTTPICEMTRERIVQGGIGTPQHILGVNYVSYGTTYFEEGYRHYDVTQGLFLQKGTHDLDYMMYLMDSPIVRIAAMATQGRVFGGDKPAGLRCSECDETRTCKESPESRKRNGSGGTQTDHECLFATDCGNPETGMNEDSSSAVFEFATGVHGAYTQVFFCRRNAHTRGATITGYDGSLRFDWYKNEIQHTRHHRPFSDTIKAGGGASHFGGDIELARDFVALIKGEITTPRSGMLAGLRSVYACLAAKESSKTGNFIDVRQVGQVC